MTNFTNLNPTKHQVETLEITPEQFKYVQSHVENLSTFTVEEFIVLFNTSYFKVDGQIFENPFNFGLFELKFTENFETSALAYLKNISFISSPISSLFIEK